VAWTEQEQQELDLILKKYPADRKLSAVLPALYLAQREKKWPVTHVHSIIGFYTLFRKESTGKYMVQVCTDLPCALRGAEDFFKRFCQRMEVGSKGGTTDDGLFTIEEVVCIAACDNAPCLQINLDYYENVTDEQLDAVIAELRQKENN